MRWVISAFLLCFGLSLAAAGQASAAEETPTHLDGVTIVTPYDLRKKASYSDGHVPGAEYAADHYDATATTLDTRFLGPDKNGRIVFYSHGSTGWKSYWAALRATEAGYSNVMWMRGGYADWAAGDHPVAR